MKKGARPDTRERFGFAVKLRREELDLTQDDLADRAGIHRTYLSDIERGTRNVSLVNIERLAAALEVSISSYSRRSVEMRAPGLPHSHERAQVSFVATI